MNSGYGGCLDGTRMSQKTFSQMMQQIGAEAEAERQAEIKAAKRHELFLRIRKACLTAVGVALVGTAYYYRVEIGQSLNAFMAKPETQTAAASETPEGEAQKSPDGEAKAPTVENALSKKQAAANVGANLKSNQSFASKRDQILGEITGK